MCEIQCFYQHILNWTFRLKQGGMNKVNREIAEYLFECVKDANQPPSGTKVKRSDNEKCLVQKQKKAFMFVAVWAKTCDTRLQTRPLFAFVYLTLIRYYLLP